MCTDNMETIIKIGVHEVIFFYKASRNETSVFSTRVCNRTISPSNSWFLIIYTCIIRYTLLILYCKVLSRHFIYFTYELDFATQMFADSIFGSGHTG